jgi:hypothetical protein
VDPSDEPDPSTPTRVSARAKVFGHRGQATTAPRRAAVGPQGQPLPAKDGTHQRGFLLIVAAVIGIGGWIVYNSAIAATKAPQSFGLGKDIFEVTNDATAFAQKIDRDGPRTYQALEGDKDHIVAHVGGIWFAFQSWTPAKGRTCQIRWVPTSKLFTDCDGSTIYTPGQPGLIYFQTIQDNNRLAVDLRTVITAEEASQAPPPLTTTAPTTNTTAPTTNTTAPTTTAPNTTAPTSTS